MCIYLNLMILIKIIRGFISAERAIGKKIMEEINQSLCTELMENILLKKEVSSLMSAYWR
ncbi:hypothetical protein G5H92_002778 [Salmonella enterica subsp. enterica serovar Senftenberg]|nr:hypothetical protein [Salmonella enterica subsp. enterica serovar Senftenberg]